MFKFKPDFPSFENIGVLYSIPCKSGCTGNIRIYEHRRDYIKSESKSILFIHSLKTEHGSDFNNCKNVKSNCNNYHSRNFLEDCHSKINKFTLNDHRNFLMNKRSWCSTSPPTFTYYCLLWIINPLTTDCFLIFQQ